MKYRKKPVVVEAWLPYTDEPMPNWYEEGLINHTIMERFDGSGIDIKTLEGIMTASNGDYIIKGINGELYPCKPDIFEKTYEVVEDE